MQLNPATEAQANSFIKKLPHGLLISGPDGIGASTLALMIARRVSTDVISILPEKDEVVDLEKGVINIALIRRLYDHTNGKFKKPRVIVIDYAERMAPPAQNAFLKLLEEPVPNVHFILVSHRPESLLPTIISRVQHLAMRPITSTQTDELLTALRVFDETKRSQITFIADGLPARITNAANDETFFEAEAAKVRDARTLIQGSSYEKLLVAQKYKDDRKAALSLTNYAMNISKRVMPKNTETLEQLLTIHERILQNGNARIQLATMI